MNMNGKCTIAVELVALVGMVLAIGIWYIPRLLSKRLYLIEVSCFRPPRWWRVPLDTFMEHSVLSGIFSAESLEFQRKILERGSLSEYTAVPPALHYLPPRPTLQAARREAEMVMFDCVNDLICKAKIGVKEIGVLVVNCSIFNPSPSLASMIISKFNLRSNIKSFNLGGMGCSANIIALDLAKNALMTVEGAESYAIVVSTENITQNWYFGNCHNMLVSNCLFRVGCGAVLLSNKLRDRHRAKYKLIHLVRTHRGGKDKAYHAAFQQEDEEGKVGVYLSKDLMAIASETLKANMAALGPLILPYHEQIVYLVCEILRKLSKGKISSYVPDFRCAFDHFCIHSGGKAVIRAVEKGLKLSEEAVEPAKMVLQRFGNTSSSSTWYQFQYLESEDRMRKGQIIWQLTFGSGFKCNSAVWVVNRDVSSPTSNAWRENHWD